VALWREGLLAQTVLQGRTKGYKHHPQLRRFLDHPMPVAAVATYLVIVLKEATRRGYRFDASKIGKRWFRGTIAETKGQLRYEWEHLQRKLKNRDPATYRSCRSVRVPEPHPLFRLVRGPIREWEKAKPRGHSHAARL